MTISRKIFLASGIAATISLCLSCGTSSPAAPGPTPNSPSISSVSPANLSPSPSVQTLSVVGSNFLSGLTFMLRAPDGSTTTYTSQSISGLTSTGFSVSVVLSAPGSWTAMVKNIDGLESLGAAFTVAGAESNGPPQILSITPGILFRNASVQSFSINGQNFRAGVTVRVTNPAGSEIQSSIASVSDSSITVNATFNATGTYTVIVINADGSQSGPFSLTVNP
jgi:hypothetical protein